MAGAGVFVGVAERDGVRDGVIDIEMLGVVLCDGEVDGELLEEEDGD